jgi:hypothetical protein
MPLNCPEFNTSSSGTPPLSGRAAGVFAPGCAFGLGRRLPQIKSGLWAHSSLRQPACSRQQGRTNSSAWLSYGEVQGNSSCCRATVAPKYLKARDKQVTPLIPGKRFGNAIQMSPNFPEEQSTPTLPSCAARRFAASTGREPGFSFQSACWLISEGNSIPGANRSPAPEMPAFRERPGENAVRC